jgi:MFS family permease
MPDISPRTRWGAVVLGLAAGVTAAAYIGKVPPALPLMRPELGLGLVSAGWVVSVINAMAMATGMVAGLFADGLGHRRMLLIGLAILALGGALGSAAEGPGVLLATRFLEGIGFISVMASAPSLIAEAAAPGDRGLALGIWSTFMPVGIAGMLVASPPVLGSFGWRGLWLAGAALAVAVVVVGLVTAGRGAGDRRPAGASPWHNIRVTVTRQGPWLLAATFLCFSLPWSAVMVWLPTFLVEQRGVSIPEAALITALVVIANVPTNVVAGWLINRGAPSWMLIALPCAIMGLSALGVFSDALPDAVRFGLCLLFSFVSGFVPGTLFAIVPVHASSPKQLGTMNGFILQGANAGQFIGAPAVAAVVAATGQWHAVQWILLATGALGVVLAFAIRAAERRGTGEGSPQAP